MKIKVQKTVEITEEIEIEFPIYSFIDGENERIYAKIDKDYKFTRITFGHVSIDLHTQKFHKSLQLQEHWVKNKCSKEEYDEAVDCAKKYLERF